MGRGGGAGRGGGGGGGPSADARVVAAYEKLRKRAHTILRDLEDPTNIATWITAGSFGQASMLTPKQQQQVARYRALVKQMNAMFAQYKLAERRQGLRAKGKRLIAKYPGTSSLTGARFDAGTPIVIGRDPVFGGRLIALESEL